MAMILTLQGDVRFAVQRVPIPGSEEGLIGFLDEQGTQFLIPTDRQAALRLADEIQRKFGSGITVARTMPIIDNPQA